MTTAEELIQRVEARGNYFTVRNGNVHVGPPATAWGLREMADELRPHMGEIVALVLERNAAPWRDPLARWLDSACVRRPRDFGRLVCLYREFCIWQGEHGGVVCTLDVFAQLLVEADYVIGDVCGVRLVSGLMLKADVLACELYERMDAMPAASTPCQPMPTTHASRRRARR